MTTLSTTRNGKKHALTCSYFIFFIVVFGLFSVVGNVFFYMSQYLTVSLTDIYHARVALLLSLLLSLAGLALIRHWGYKRVIKAGLFMSVLGLLSAALCASVNLFIVSGAVFVGGLAFSMPALFVHSCDAFKHMEKHVAIPYGAFVAMIASLDGLLVAVNSFYGFKALCCALAALLIISMLTFRLHATVSHRPALIANSGDGV